MIFVGKCWRFLEISEICREVFLDYPVIDFSEVLTPKNQVQSPAMDIQGHKSQVGWFSGF